VIAWGKNDLGQCLGTDTAGAPIVGTAVGQRVRILGEILSGVKEVAGGEDFSVACLQNGSVVCWGRTDLGLHQPPTGMESIVEVGAGQSHILARTASGRVVGWGWNNQGQCLGTDAQGQPITSSPNGTPVRINGETLIGVAEIDAGYAHSLVRRFDGTVVAWGNNSFQQSTVPQFSGPAVSISAGWYHSLVCLADGSVQGFGRSTLGQTATQQGGSPRVRVAGGVDHSIAVLADGTLSCWGGNYQGECSSPDDLGLVKQIEAGGNHTIGLLPNGRIRCWGWGASGQTSLPPGLPSTATAVAGGGIHSMALFDSGRVICWGDNTFGKCLGTTATGQPILGIADGQSVQHLGQELTDAIGISGGYEHSIAVRANGTVVAWGFGGDGRCHPPSDLNSVVRAVAGGSHSLALRQDSTVVGWGLNDAGQCLGTSTSGAPITGAPAGEPVRRLGVVLSGVVEIAAGFDNSLAVLSGGAVVAWGSNDSGQSSVPAQLPPARRVAAGWGFSAALLENGSVICWGYNAAGQCLGTDAQGLPITGPTTGDAVKVRGAVLTTADDLACGWDHTLVMLDGEVSVCENQGGVGRAELVSSGCAWENTGIWRWTSGSPQVPGALTEVDLGLYGAVGSLCGAQCSTFQARGGSTLLVPVDLTIPGNKQPDHAISVEGTAAMAGRIWLIGSGATTLPLDLDVPVFRTGNPQGGFDIVETTVPPPAGKFLGLVRTDGTANTAEFSLRLLEVLGSAEVESAESAFTSGKPVAIAPMDWNGDGVDDLLVLLDLGVGQSGALQVILNDGTGNLGDNVCEDCRVPTGLGPTCLAVGDIDGDGRQDALVGTSNDQRVVVFMNNAPSQQEAFTAGLSISIGVG